jgi:hypothetical protein
MGPARGVWGGSSNSSRFNTLLSSTLIFFVLCREQVARIVRLLPVDHGCKQG